MKKILLICFLLASNSQLGFASFTTDLDDSWGESVSKAAHETNEYYQLYEGDTFSWSNNYSVIRDRYGRRVLYETENEANSQNLTLAFMLSAAAIWGFSQNSMYGFVTGAFFAVQALIRF